jgi:UDP-N-acetylglucosamine 4-epimerase
MNKYEQLQDFLKVNQSTWLVTGAAGFIGSNIVEKLLILNQKVIGLDNFDSGYQHNIDHAIKDASRATGKNLIKNFKFVHGDVRDLIDCHKACDGVDYVLHQAAIGSVPRSIKDPCNTNRTNIDGFLNMMIASKEANVKRFVYASSSSSYGDQSDLPKVEDKIGSPLSPYAVSKIVNELYADVFAKVYGFRTIGLRYFNIFGKRQDPNGAYAAVIPKWVSAILNNEEIYINGDGETSRDFCYIDNTVQVNLLAATTSLDEATNQIYNVALNESTSLNKLYQMIEEKIGQRKHDIEKKAPIYQDFRVGDIRHSKANIDKAKLLLNYQPKYTLNEGLDHTMDWYIDSLDINNSKEVL